MNITPRRKCKIAYPTLAAISAGAVILAGSSCQQKQVIGGNYPAQSTAKAATQYKNTPKRTPQTVIGRARLDLQTGELIQPGEQKSEEPLLGGSALPPKPPRKIQKQQPMGRYLIDDWQNDVSTPGVEAANADEKSAGEPPKTQEPMRHPGVRLPSPRQ